MEKNTMSLSRKIDLGELNQLAKVGGNDYAVEPNAVTTPACAIIATILVSAISATYITSVNPELC